MGKVVGIDLGTTNSCVAVMEGGKPTVIANAEGFRTTPSVVAYTKNQDKLVGQIAKRQAVMNPENTFYSVKRFIGRRVDEVNEESKEVSYTVEKAGSNVKLKAPVLNKQFAPEEISAEVLRKLADDAGKYLGETVTQAVITVPAYFNDSQRQATKDAGKIAGLEVLRIINEPTAAALAYGLDKKSNERILVFDLGGGTFDVSVLEVGDGVLEVLSTSGDTHLGGDDFDKVIVDHLADSFKANEGIDLRADKQALQRLTEAAEKAKIELSSATQSEINLPFITATPEGPKHLDLTLTRAKFEELASKLIDRCRVPVEQALKDAKLSAAELDEVVMVPTKKTEVYSTAVDGQTNVEIHVLQGEREMASDNKSLGTFRLDGIPPAPRGVPQIEVTFDIDANGILSVTAKDKGSGKEQSISITGASTLSENEVERMVKDAESNAAADKEKREKIDLKNQAETLIYQAEKQLGELGDKVGAEDKAKVEQFSAQLKEAVANDDTATIKTVLEQLQQALYSAGAAVYQNAGADAAAGAPGGNGSSGNGASGGSSADDVIDAEFTESK